MQQLKSKQVEMINNINKLLIEGWGTNMAIHKAGLTESKVSYRITGFNAQVLKEMTNYYYQLRKKTPHGVHLRDFFGGKEYRGPNEN